MQENSSKQNAPPEDRERQRVNPQVSKQREKSEGKRESKTG